MTEEDLRLLLGRRIRQEREKAGYTRQVQFADRLGISKSKLSRIEAGTIGVDSFELRRIADCLDVPMDSLFREPAARRAVAYAREGETGVGAMVGMAERVLTDIEFVLRETRLHGIG
jgi:transcriptional regulator with XRE-family HTH domain